MHAQLPDTLKLFPSKGYKEAVFAWEGRFKGFRMGYVPGVIQHHNHGSVKDR
jgi:GT2 family glycosyltransferase